MKAKFSYSTSDVFKSSLEIIETLNWTISEANESEYWLIVSTKMSIWSWGEEIEIQIRQVNNLVEVEVNSRAQAQLFSWGKNDENEKIFLNQLTNLLERS